MVSARLSQKAGGAGAGAMGGAMGGAMAGGFGGNGFGQPMGMVRAPSFFFLLGPDGVPPVAHTAPRPPHIIIPRAAAAARAGRAG